VLGPSSRNHILHTTGVVASDDDDDDDDDDDAKDRRSPNSLLNVHLQQEI
jgi:hypothetical protein